MHGLGTKNNFVIGCDGGQKARMTVLARTSSNLPDTDNNAENY
jgi:hypothetical protein